MKIIASFVLAVAAAALLTGCTAPFGAPVYGSLITVDVKGPVAVGDPSVKCEDKGVSQASAIIFFATGDASIKAAMDEGDIRKIHHVDCKAFSVLGLYSKYETIVYGEK